MLMMRRWVCGQPPPDASKLHATPEGVVHKSTGGSPCIPLRDAMPSRPVEPARESARRGTAAMSLLIP